MIKQLLARPLLGAMVKGMLGESVGYVPPPPPPPPQVPQGTISFPSPTKTDTTISQPFTYSASDFTGFYYKLNNGAQLSASSPIALTGLTAETTYNIKVAAYNATGTGTWYETNVTTDAAEPPPPPPPTVPNGTTNITNVVATDTTADITFTYTAGSNGLDYTGFEYQLNGGAWTAAPASPGTFQLTGLIPSTAYALYMRAYNAVGNGLASAVYNFSTQAPPPPPPTTRWQYTLDGVDDRLSSSSALSLTTKPFNRDFTGVYTIKFYCATPSLYRMIINQGLTGTVSSGMDFGFGRSSAQNYNFYIFGASFTNQAMPAGSFSSGGEFVLTYNMTTGQFTFTKNGILLVDTIHVKGALNIPAPYFVMGARRSSGSYDQYLSGMIKDLEIWEDSTLVLGCEIGDKDSLVQTTTGSRAITLQLQNQNPANWAEVPL